MIEVNKPHISRPTGRVVAGLATRGEATLVWICVARGALVERKPYVLYVWLRVNDRRMALVARDRDVRACERKF